MPPLSTIARNMLSSTAVPACDRQRSSRSEQRNANEAISTNRSSNTQSAERSAQTYGYHNTFHTHSRVVMPTPPPTYTCATSPGEMARFNAIADAESNAVKESLPSYTCSVEIEGAVALKHEMASPFRMASDRQWHDVYMILRGTQLSVYRLKNPNILSKSKVAGPGRLLRTYSLQHAEVGIASDFKKTPLVPRSTFAHLVPVSARQKVYQTDPHLFEPVREHVLRLRLETEQMLVCCSQQEDLLDWVEALCAAIDISPPLEDRSEPRYRSLPRRSRRQRLLDGSRVTSNIDNLENFESDRRFLAEQERIIRMLYPHLANSSNSSRTVASTEQPEQQEHDEQARGAHNANESEVLAPTGDPDTDDLDPADVRFPGSMQRPSSSDSSRIPSRNGDTALSRQTTRVESPPLLDSSDMSISTSDRKTAPHHVQTPSQTLRYRRRCAPILLASSPRSSEVILFDGQRARVDVKDYSLVDYVPHPPRYDAHAFVRKPKRPTLILEERPSQANEQGDHQPMPGSITRPSSPLRESSDDSLTHSFSSLDLETSNFGYDLTATSSEQPGHVRSDEADDITSVHPVDSISEPPSPTTTNILSKAVKVDAARQLVELGKRRTSEDGMRETGLSAVAVGIGMLI